MISGPMSVNPQFDISNLFSCAKLEKVSGNLLMELNDMFSSSREGSCVISGPMSVNPQFDMSNLFSCAKLEKSQATF